MKTQQKKWIFGLLVLLSFLAILFYNFLTPYMTDDMSYGAEVAKAAGIFDLLRQEYEQYLTWNGRSVVHMILRLFLSGDKWIFNVFNSVVFIGLGFLIYVNAAGRKKPDIALYVFIQLLLWVFAVDFSQTVLWETGACNYLWGAFIIMSFLTMFRYMAEHEDKLKRRWLWVIGIFFLGILGGWCNENTSGGGILLVLILFIVVWKVKKKIPMLLLPGVIGSLLGFGMMIMAPGNAIRSAAQEENYTGLLAIASRTLKCTLTVGELFFWPLVIGIVFAFLIWFQTKQWKKLIPMGVWAFAFLATCYALILTPEPMSRAYFGAGIFLFVALCKGFTQIKEEETWVKTLKYSLLTAGVLAFFFVYVEAGADLARILREENERTEYLIQKKEDGETSVTIPMYRPQFENKYTNAYASDISEDSGNWINRFYAEYYGLDEVSGMPREDWTEY